MEADNLTLGNVPILGENAEGNQPPFDGFIVVRVKDEKGNYGVAVHPVGEATVLEAPAVLSMALNAAKQKVGME